MTSTPDIKALCERVSDMLGKESVSSDDRLVEDLGAESIDLVSLVAEMEEMCHVTIPEEDLARVHTVRDLHDVISSAKKRA